MTDSKGMTLVELMVSVAVIMIVLGGATAAYLKLLGGFGTQSKIAERYMENLVGLEMLRHDVEMAGYGLPHNMNGNTYLEALSDASFSPNPNNSSLDDAALSTSAIPRSFGFSDNTGVNGSDVLALKSQVATLSSTTKKWTIMFHDGTNARIRQWNSSELDFSSSERFIVMDSDRRLLPAGGTWFFTFNTNFYTTAAAIDGSTVPRPLNNRTVHLLYGVDPNSNPRMPFNRVDYYLKRPTTAGSFPTRCNPNSFILYRSSINQGDGRRNEQPLLECVMDLQIAFGVDTDADGGTDAWRQNLTLTDTNGNGAADEIRGMLKEVRVFVLYHEGQRDENYAAQTLTLSDDDIAAVAPAGIGAPLSTFDPSAAPANLNYRWKVAKIAVKPINME